MLLLLLACNPGKKACEDYVEALSACYEAVGATETSAGIVAATPCEEVPDEDAARYDCLAGVWESAACETTDDLTEAGSAASACPL